MLVSIQTTTFTGANHYIEPNLFYVIDTIIIMILRSDFINLGKLHLDTIEHFIKIQ